LFGGREVGIEAEDAEQSGAGVGELVGSAIKAGEVHADLTSARGAIESGLPKLQGFVELTLIGFDGAKIGGGFERIGVERESFLVERSSVGKIATLLRGIGESGEKSGIAGRFAESCLQEFFCLRLGHGHAARDDGLPGESEVACVSGGVGGVGKGNEGGEGGGGGGSRGGDSGGLRIARDAVVGDLRVGYVGTERSRHVATGAVRLVLVVPGGKFLAVAGDAFGAEVGDAIFECDGLMRIVAGGAGERVAGFFLAAAFGEGFKLAGGAESGRNVARENKVADVVRKVVTGMEFVDVFASAFDGGVALKMTLHADLIATRGRQLGRIDDGCGGILRMGRAGAVATFAGDTGEKERRIGIEVVAAVEGRADAADVAVHATGGGGEIEGHEGRRAVGGGHVPKVAVGVPVHRGFEDETVGGEKVSAAAASLADIVEEFALAVNEGVAGSIEGEEDLAVVVGDFVMDARGLMGEFTGNEI